jgi:16S rRNA (cytidine1402-2'-O)-methyltransferase
VATLYLVSTPIGNLEDITLRALRILEEVSLIAAEDTRRAAILTDRYRISTPVTSYYEGNKLAKLETVLAALREGDVALISEAGTPGLSDPGYELIKAAISRGFPVVPIPGPSAPVAALIASGLPSDSFVYVGFLPRRSRDRRRLLEQIAAEPRTVIAFEAPHRLRQALADTEEILGNRPIAACRELTKLHEEIVRGTVADVRAHFDEHEPRGEFTLVLGGAAVEPTDWSREAVEHAFTELLGQGMSRSAAAREVAHLTGWRRSDIYRFGLEAD